MPISDQDKQTLNAIAVGLADQVAEMVNKAALDNTLSMGTVHYPAQAILETLIQELQRRV